MGRGKIEIKKIESRTNRQVIYSKRRNRIFKKAQELTVLCDAKVSVIMFSNTGELHEFISPNTTTKKMCDQYQRALGCDLWGTHYENMQENLRRLKEVNNRLRREIRHRVGTDDLSDLTQNELCGLEQKMEDSIAVVRKRKYHVITNQTDTCRKKVRYLEERHGNLLLDFEAKCQVDPRYASADDEKDYDDSMVSFAYGVSNPYALHMHHSFHGGGGGFGGHDLRLA